MFLGLRQLAGIDLRRIERSTASLFSPGSIASPRQGCSCTKVTSFAFPPAKMSVSNEVFVELLRDLIRSMVHSIQKEGTMSYTVAKAISWWILIK